MVVSFYLLIYFYHVFSFSKYWKLFFCGGRAPKSAAFEVPAPLNVDGYEQTLLPASVAGAAAHVGKTKANHCGSPVIKCQSSKDTGGRVSARGSGSGLPRGADSELHRPARTARLCT